VAKKIKFVCDEKGKILPIAANIRIALLKLGVGVRYDQFADRSLLDGLPGYGPVLEDAAVNHLWLQFMERLYFFPKCLFDPWQMQASAQRLAKAGVRIEEFPQSPANLTSASQNLFDLIQAQGLVLYPDATMRLAASRAVAKETERLYFFPKCLFDPWQMQMCDGFVSSSGICRGQDGTAL
jgi:hypothetical protein